MRTPEPDPWRAGGLPLLNVAATCPATRALGPGRRAAVWVQGCPFHCPGCIAPEFIPRHLVRLVCPEALAEELLAQPGLAGLTFSGGEPMLQAAGLAALTRLARKRRALSIICFTGFTLEQLRRRPPGPGVAELLAEVDVLIDGPYRNDLNDNRGLRGSRNQRIHYLTGRLKEEDLESQPRKVEIQIHNGYALFIGVPPTQVVEALDHVFGPIHIPWQEVQNEPRKKNIS